ncbi:MAG: hypothetical protein RMJ88_05075 [Thermogemmata sp.]|nr:hypothetical protein [Thermogemmata sp.]
MLGSPVFDHFRPDYFTSAPCPLRTTLPLIDKATSNLPDPDLLHLPHQSLPLSTPLFVSRRHQHGQQMPGCLHRRKDRDSLFGSHTPSYLAFWSCLLRLPIQKHLRRSGLSLRSQPRQYPPVMGDLTEKTRMHTAPGLC